MQYIKHYCTVPCRDIETPTGELKIAIPCMSSSQRGGGCCEFKTPVYACELPTPETFSNW